MILVKRFLDQTKIREYLATLNLPQPGSNPIHIIESFWLSIWIRASRYIHCDWLRAIRFCNLFSDGMPSQITCSDSLESFHKRETPKYFIPLGCAASYFPEANVLVPVTSVADKSNTPTSKQVIIKVKKHGSKKVE